MERTTRRDALKRGLLIGAGAAGVAIAGGAVTVTALSAGSRSFTIHGRSWSISSPARRRGELPTSGEQMLIEGELVANPSGPAVGRFYATHLAVASPGTTAVEAPASLETHHFDLGDGTIVGTGVASRDHALPDAFAILGGTGAYAGVRGSYVATQSPLETGGDGTATFTFTLIREGGSDGER